MDNKYISDDLLYQLVPKAEELLLNQIPSDEEIDHKFSKCFERKMKKLIKDSKRSNAAKMLRKIAMIFFVVLSILSISIVSVEALRVRAFRVIKKIYEEFTQIKFEYYDEPVDQEDIGFIVMKPYYLPEGYEEIDCIEMDTAVIIIYENQQEGQIIYRQNKIEEYGTTIIDTEDVEIQDIRIKGNEGQIIIKGERNHIVWFSDEYHYSIISTVGRKELIKIAESIK